MIAHAATSCGRRITGTLCAGIATQFAARASPELLARCTGRAGTAIRDKHRRLRDHPTNARNE
ncbi:hypothetical protein WT98_01510 [Burkholderia territorii]|nr:hypothetical protein WT98_01510 [Burkholderia territorii]